MGQLTNQYVSQSYQGLIKLEDSTTGVTGTLQYVQDGLGNNLPMLASTSSIVITGSFRGDGSGLTGVTIDSSSLVTTSSFNAFTSSYYVDSGSFDSRIDGIIAGTGSYVTVPDFNVYTSSIDNTLTSLENETGSLQSQINGKLGTGSFNAYTSSNDSKVNSLISATGSYATTSSLSTLSGSIATTDLGQNNRLNSIETVTGSLQLEVNQKLNTGSFNAYTSSNDTKVNDLISKTGSYVTETESGSFVTSVTGVSDTITVTKGNGTTNTVTVNNVANATSASFAQNAISSSHSVNSDTAVSASQSQNSVSASQAQNAVTASFAMNVSPVDLSYYATTGSNNFVGQQNIDGSVNVTGSLNVTGEITALSASITYLETIYQTSSIIFSSGSNILGDEASDTQTLNGTVNIPLGNLNVTGATTSSLGFYGNLYGTSSYSTNALSASQSQNSVSSSYSVNSDNSVSSSFAQNAISSSYSTNSGTAISSSYALNAENSISSSFAVNAVTSSFALNGGVTQLLAGPNITISPLSGKGQVTISSTGASTGSFNTATGSYGSFYSTQTQTNPVANTPVSMSFNETAITNGVEISGSISPYNTYIKTEDAGVYNIQFSAQVDKTDGGSDNIDIWIRKNGIDLLDTATVLTLPTNNSKVVAAWNWFVQSAANDYYQLIWSSADTAMRLLAEPSSSQHPGIPSVILTANRVDQFLSNTGSFNGDFNGSFTGSLFGTSSYSDFAVSSSQSQNSISSSFAQNAVSASYAPSVSFDTGSFATTGSNTFIGNQVVTGSIRSTGQIRTDDSVVVGTTLQTNNITNPGTSGDITINPSSGFKVILDSDTEVTGTLVVTNGITGSLEGSSSYAVTASFTPFAEAAVTASYALNANVNTSSLATTGSNVFRGTQYISGSADISGSLFVRGDSVASLVGRSFAYLTSSLSSGGNIFFQDTVATSLTTQSLVVSSSANIIFNRTQFNSTTFDSVIPGTTQGSNIFSVPPTISVTNRGQILPISMSHNIGRGTGAPFQLTFSTGSLTGSMSVSSNIVAGAILYNGSQYNRLPNFNNNNIQGTLQYNANVLNPYASVLATFPQIGNNIINGTVTLSARSGSIGFSNNNVNGNANIINNFTPFSGSQGLLFNNNNIGNNPAITVIGTSNNNGNRVVNSNIIQGTSISIFGRNELTSSGSFVNSLVVGQGLTVTAAHSDNAGAIGHSTFLGRFNETSGNLSDSAQTIFALGTGLSSGAARTSLHVSSSGLFSVRSGMVQSGSLELVNNSTLGPMNLTGSLNVSGTLSVKTGGINVSGAQISTNGEIQFNGGTYFPQQMENFVKLNATSTTTLTIDNFNLNTPASQSLWSSTVNTGSNYTEQLAQVANGGTLGRLELRNAGGVTTYTIDVKKTVVTGSIQGNVLPLTVSSNTASLNLDNGNFFELALTGSSDIRIEPSNIKPGQTVNLKLNTTGSGTVSFPSSVKQVSGSSYVPSTGTTTDIVTLVSFDSSNLYLANVKNLI